MGEQQTIAAKINGKYAVITALIGGACLVISAFIGIFSFDINKANKTLVIENTELYEENNDWKSAYDTLQEQFNNLNSQNSSLLNELDNIKNSMEQYSSLIDENNSLKAENDSLKDEINQLQMYMDDLEKQINELSKIPVEIEEDALDTDSIFIYHLDYFTGNDLSVKSIVKDNLGEEQNNVVTSGIHNTYVINGEFNSISGIIFIPYEYRNAGQCSLKIYNDDKILYDSSIKYGEFPLPFSVDISGVTMLHIDFSWTFGGGLAECKLSK